MKTVVLTEPIDKAGTDLLDRRADVTWRLAKAFDHGTLSREIVDADAVVTRIAQLPADVLQRAPNLQIVSKHGVGCDNVAVDYLTSKGLAMAIANGANAQSVCEHTMGMMLAAARRLREQDFAMRHDDFNARHQLIATDLSGASGLVIGFGRVGKKVARVMKAFGMDVTVADIALDHKEAERIGVKTVVDFTEALPDADFVSLHIPLDDKTANILDKEMFARFKPGSVFVNCARGGIMDEAALEWALEEGPVIAAAVDVFTEEPTPSSHPLFKRDDIVVSPHTGAASFGSVKAMSTMACQNVLDHFDGKLDEDCLFNTEILNGKGGK